MPAATSQQLGWLPPQLWQSESAAQEDGQNPAEQSAPLAVPKQWHVVSEQVPFPEQPFGQQLG